MSSSIRWTGPLPWRKRLTLRLRNFHQLVVSTATASAAFSCGTGDRVEYERYAIVGVHPERRRRSVRSGSCGQGGTKKGTVVRSKSVIALAKKSETKEARN